MFSPAWSLTPSDPGSLPSPSTANSSKLIRSWGYLARVASWATADRLVDEIEAAANRLVIDPRMHRVRRDLIPNLPGELRAAPAHPYTFFYRMNPQSAHGHEEIEILRVVHERRDFPSELPNNS